MLARAFDADVPARWVVADAFYGRSHELRRWLEARGRPYALMIPKTNAVRYRERRERAEQLGERLCLDPAHGPWACLELSDACAAGMRRWLLVRRSISAPQEMTAYVVFAPQATALEEVVRVVQNDNEVGDDMVVRVRAAARARASRLAAVQRRPSSTSRRSRTIR